MDIIKIKDKEFKPFITQQDIQDAVKKLAKQINHDYNNKAPLFLGVLNGSFMFAADLLKLITLQCHISFVKVASYDGTKTTGNVNELIGLTENIQGKDVIIIEDIVDTGNTLEKIYSILKEKNPKSIKIATLLYKPDAYKKQFNIDYVAKEIPNKFVLGYGLDYDGLGRNLNSIYVLKD